MAKKLLPYIGIPFLLAVYLAFRVMSDDILTIFRAAILIAFGYIAAYGDIKTRKVPNKLIVAMLASWALHTSISVVVNIEAAPMLLVQSLIGGAAAGGFFFFIYLVSRKGIGGGDVKFIAVTGLFLTFAKVMPMLLISSLLAALTSGILLLTKRATMKSAIPLVPFLYIGTLMTLLL